MPISKSNPITRGWLLGLLMVAVITAGCTAEDQTDVSPGLRADQVSGHVLDERGAIVPGEIQRIQKPDATWRAELTSEQYDILRKGGTERPFTGALLKNKKSGVYTCAGCDLPLFTSTGKFDSGTGWPSFTSAIGSNNVTERPDRSYGMVRTEINCGRCDGHLGHVFEDGPPPTGRRYCVNSASLDFRATEGRPVVSNQPTTTTRPATTAPAEPDMIKQNPTLTRNATPSADGTTGRRATIVLAGGCFWCVEAVFEELDGVIDAVSGYAGDTREKADYRLVAAGRTRHAEAVRITYDPAKISYVDLLLVHFKTHDPTQLNRQGNDVGPQYRSSIFYQNAEEKALAKAFIEDVAASKLYRKPIVTTLEPLTEFFPAESYHQNYVCNNPTQGYVRAIALPKVEKVRKEFKDRLKAVSPLESGK